MLTGKAYDEVKTSFVLHCAEFQPAHVKNIARMEEEDGGIKVDSQFLHSRVS